METIGHSPPATIGCVFFPPPPPKNHMAMLVLLTNKAS